MAGWDCRKRFPFTLPTIISSPFTCITVATSHPRASSKITWYNKETLTLGNYRHFQKLTYITLVTFSHFQNQSLLLWCRELAICRIAIMVNICHPHIFLSFNSTHLPPWLCHQSGLFGKWSPFECVCNRKDQLSLITFHTKKNTCGKCMW